MNHDKFNSQTYQTRTNARFDPQPQSDVPPRPTEFGGYGSGSGQGHICKAVRKVPASSAGICIGEAGQTTNVPHGDALPPRGGKGAIGIDRGKGKAIALGSKRSW